MKKVLLMGLFFAIIFLILAGLVLLARKKKTLFWVIISVILLMIIALFARNKFMNYYKFIDEECGFTVSDNLIFLEEEKYLKKSTDMFTLRGISGKDICLVFQVKERA